MSKSRKWYSKQLQILCCYRRIKC